jgi:hypothetical protein
MSSTDDESAGGVTIIVKGGTTSSRYDREIQRRRVDAEQRREEQNRMYRQRREAPSRGAASRIGEAALINQSSPRLVLNYLNADGSLRQQCKSEITVIPIKDRQNEWETMFALVCPKCLARGLPMGEAQMLVRDTHRKFHIRETRNPAKGLPGKGDVVMIEYAWGIREAVKVAGTVTCEDIIRCSNHNCNYAVRIEDSKVREV